MSEKLNTAHSIGRQLRSLQEKNNIDIHSQYAVNALTDLCKGDKIKAYAYYLGIERVAGRAESPAWTYQKGLSFELPAIARELADVLSSGALAEVIYAMHGYLMQSLQSAESFNRQDWKRIRDEYEVETILQRIADRESISNRRKQLKRLMISPLASACCLLRAIAILPWVKGLRLRDGEKAEYKLQLKTNCGGHGVIELLLNAHGVRVSERINNLAYPAILKTDMGRIFGSVAFPQGTYKNLLQGEIPREDWFIFESNDGSLTLQSETSGKHSYAEIKEEGIITECTESTMHNVFSS